MIKKRRFSEKMAELEELVEQLNSDIEIEEAVSLYEKGVKLAKEVRKYLGEAEKKIRILTEDGMSEVDEESVGKTGK